MNVMSIFCQQFLPVFHPFSMLDLHSALLIMILIIWFLVMLAEEMDDDIGSMDIHTLGSKLYKHSLYNWLVFWCCLHLLNCKYYALLHLLIVCFTISCSQLYHIIMPALLSSRLYFYSKYFSKFWFFISFIKGIRNQTFFASFIVISFCNRSSVVNCVF